MIEVVVESIRVNFVTKNRVIILNEVDGERHLPIWIGDFEAHAISGWLKGEPLSRPLPYDLAAEASRALDGTADHATIS